MCCSTETITVAARSSALSRAQVDEVLQALRIYHPAVAFEPIWVETTGDRDQTTSLRTRDKTDFFTREIDALLQTGQCRVAIHSAKDLPDPLPEGLVIAALTCGVDDSDSLVLQERKRFEDLPIGARIGTSSVRREENIRLLRKDLQCVDIRGTIAQRLSLLEEGIVDGVIIAEAALIRLKLSPNRISLPGECALGQGQLAVLVQDVDEEMRQLFAPLDTQKKTILYLGTDPAEFHKNSSSHTTLIHYPLIHTVAREMTPEALAAIEECTHCIFTSKNCVHHFFAKIRENKKLLACCVIAIGRSTARALAEYGYRTPLIAPHATQEGVIALLQMLPLENAHIFLPRSSLSRPRILDYLRHTGIRHTCCDLYDTKARPPYTLPVLEAFDEIYFTSPSTIDAFLEHFGTLPILKQCRCIGPITRAHLDKKLQLICVNA